MQRSIRKDELDRMMAIATSDQAKKDLKTRQHLMERSFARSTRFRFDRARWRGLWKVAIQEYLICAIQNIQTLIRHGRKQTQGVLAVCPVKSMKALTDRSLVLLAPMSGRVMLKTEGSIVRDFGC